MGKIPDPALIESMAMRYRHDFGVLHKDEKAAIRRLMCQLWEEVVGVGFYQYPANGTVLGSTAEDQLALWDRYLMTVGKHELSKLSIREAFFIGAYMAFTQARYRHKPLQTSEVH